LPEAFSDPASSGGGEQDLMTITRHMHSGFNAADPGALRRAVLPAA
jgi:hypothetical protein